jgi:thiol:disulfide interchange protein
MKYLVLLLLLFSFRARGADTTKLYNPFANVAKDMALLMATAQAEKKHILIQVGGNWCVWCYKFNAFVQTDSTLKRMVAGSYVLYHLNYSKENRNEATMARLGYPQRFGFPVLLVLDAQGNRLHTQDNTLLQKGNGYDFEKVKSFLYNWSPVALMSQNYKEG